MFCSPFHCHIVRAAQIIWNGPNWLQFNPIQFCLNWIGTSIFKNICLKKKLGRQFKLDVWIVKNWQFKQNIQIELIKIDNSNKTFKFNWKKLQIQTKYSNWIEKIENSNQKIKLNWNILILNNWILKPLKLNMSLGAQEWECLKCVSVSRFQ